MIAAADIRITRTSNSKLTGLDIENLPFGKYFTDHMLEADFENGEWKERETNPQECVVKSGNAAVQCSFRTNDGGRYRVTASIIDDRERRNESQMTLWVAGGKTEPQRDVAQEKVELIPDRKEYEAGQSAEILVQAPFFPAEGVVTLRRSGLVSTERFTMTTASHTLKIPINEAYVPNLHVQVDLVGAASRTDDAGNVKNNRLYSIFVMA